MSELLTAAQMRAIETAAIEGGEVTGLALMENAGRGTVAAIFRQWPELAKTPLHAVVLCGPGNNGGDGFVIARRLRDKGWNVEVLFWGKVSKLPPDARKMRDLWKQMGPITTMNARTASEGERPALLIDAMFGTGLTRPIPLDCAQAFHAVCKRPVGKKRHPFSLPFHIVAVDCPSGMDCDGGEFLTPDIRAAATGETEEDLEAWNTALSQEVYPRLLRCDLCATFHRAKVGHYLRDVSRQTPVVVDIGLGESDIPELTLLGSGGDPDRVRLIAPDIKKLGKSANVWAHHYGPVSRSGHKYDRGHALVLAGGTGRGGAARMAARAALRSGAGLVTIGAPAEAMVENASQLNAIMLREIDDAAALETTLRDDRMAVLCMGPGLGIGAQTRGIVETALRNTAINEGYGRRRFVLDADALTSFAEQPEALFDLCHDHVVLTPHEGEFARLFPDLAERTRHSFAAPGLSKVEAARVAAHRSGALVLLKGAATVIASPDGTASIHSALYDRAAPQLATAGAGDVLAGMILGVLANPMATMHLHRCVEFAAWLHAECARKFGPGLIAEDLPEQIPAVYRDLGL